MVETITSDVCGSRRRQAGGTALLRVGRARRLCVRGCRPRAGRIAYRRLGASRRCAFRARRCGAGGRLRARAAPAVAAPGPRALAVQVAAPGLGGGLRRRARARLSDLPARGDVLGRVCGGSGTRPATGRRALLRGLRRRSIAPAFPTAPAGLGRDGHRRGARRPPTRRPPRECRRVACLRSAADGTGSRCRAHPARAWKPVRSVRDRARIRVYAA